MNDLLDLDVQSAHDLLCKKKVSAEELTRAYLKRIDDVDERINAFITIDEELALQMARDADRRIKQSNMTPLTGIPIALKDILVTKKLRTTCASKILQDFIPPYDATVCRELRDAGAVFLGKTNMDEFAMGASNENSAFGAVSNPWDLKRVPGGSSGGSAAAVAAQECLIAIGTDTGGSIRQPASHCGIVGLKPTYGRVSRFGVIAFASSLDQVGPMGHSVLDCAYLLQGIAGFDPKDSTSIPDAPPDYLQTIEHPPRGLRVGVPKEYFGPGLDREVRDIVRGAIAHLEGLGLAIQEISLPNSDYAVADYYILATAEASSNLARYDGMRYGLRVKEAGLKETYCKTRDAGFGKEVKRRILLGTYVLSSGYYDSFYLKAQKVRTLIRQDFENAFETVDLIAGPVAPTAAFPLGENVSDPLKMYLCDIYTTPVNLAGLPGLSLPCGFDSNRLPVGLQLIGKPYDEQTLLRVGHHYQQSTEWHKRRPALD